MTRPNRRTFVKLVAAGAVAPAVAGCTGGGDQGQGAGNGDGGGGGGGGGSVPAAIDSYLSGANGYDGSIADRTGQGSVTIEVGAGDDGLAFAPAAVRVDAGTTVTWEWTGRGSMHNVVAEDDSFRSEYHDTAGETFEYTFEETGDTTYYCEPHKSVGMKGGIAVR